MNYLDRIALDIFNHGRSPHLQEQPTADELPLYRIYAVLCLAKGRGTTLKDVHDAWAAWRATARPDHHSLIPFAELRPEVQDLDMPYRDAIHAAARRHAC